MSTAIQPRDHGEITVQIEAITRRVYAAVETCQYAEARALVATLADLADELACALADTRTVTLRGVDAENRPTCPQNCPQRATKTGFSPTKGTS